MPATIQTCAKAVSVSQLPTFSKFAHYDPPATRQCGAKSSKRTREKSDLIAIQAAQSLAVAVAIVVFGHFLIWSVAESVMMPDALGDTSVNFEYQSDAP